MTGTERKSPNEITDPVAELRTAVEAAQDEIMMAIMFHETWRPTVDDETIRGRMGKSFATHPFSIIRLALRREMLLALMRMWDTTKRGLRMTAIAEKLRDKRFFDALVETRAARLNLRSSFASASMRKALEPKRDAVLTLIQKYMKDGDAFEVFDKIQTLRHEQLAHHQLSVKEPIEPTKETEAEPHGVDPTEAPLTDKEIESFYQDNMEIVRLLLSLVLATAFDVKEDATSVYGHHANYFWAGVRGERTEGHPNYLAPPDADERATLNT
jgi:hypothetical protein